MQLLVRMKSWLLLIMWTLRESLNEFELRFPAYKIGIATGKVAKRNVESSKNA